MSEVVPFGKYRGMPVEVMLADSNYCDWLSAQPWVKERFQNVYNTIVNINQNEPSCTPEHNRLQARFMDEEFRNKLIWWVTDKGKYKILSSSVRFETVSDVLIEMNLSGFTTERDYKSKRIVPYNFRDTAAVEVKPTIGDDYPAILRQVLNQKMSRGNRDGYGQSVKNFYVVFEQFDSEAVSETECRNLFAASGIGFLSTAMIENCDTSQYHTLPGIAP